MKKKMKKLGGWRRAGPMDLKFKFMNFKFKIQNCTNKGKSKQSEAEHENLI